MPKKQKNRLSFIVNSRINVKHGKPNVNVNNSNNNFTDVRPSFPPDLTINDLIKKTVNNTKNKPKTFPNAYIAYRMALVKECHNKNWKLPPMGEFSKITSNSWNTEPKHVKDFYDSLVKEAKSNYKLNNIQFVLDKHMSNNVPTRANDEGDVATTVNYVENNQEGGHDLDSFVTYDANVATICTENSPNSIQNDVSASHYNVSSVNNSLTDNSEMISDQEYIKLLEQIIDCLLRS
ncbi:hypothetical protein RclHR1_06420017 [Rhizophagus clarus]|uniref:HMG box domain-containing protein n=1 Tax=Rhizophagus clarus TaxID=94130 RepID=A0A2Z6RST5_9GLOM|nr:hypothetical protein RclHR1_06420017 [Rhizophagus clarus]